MSSDAEAHVLYRIGNALVLEYPYPHILVRDIFPDDFYRELRENLPEAQQMSTVESLGRVSIGVNPGRVVMPLTRENCARLGGRKGQFWERLGSWLMGDTFGQMMIRKFGPWLEQRFPDLSQARLQDEALIQREETHFGLGPHTDAGSKVLAFHFYLPADASTSQLGTSIYAPKDPAFVCPGGPYYPHADFRRMQTLPYAPNTLFAFVRGDQSFHGVEPTINPGAVRYVLSYDINLISL